MSRLHADAEHLAARPLVTSSSAIMHMQRWRTVRSRRTGELVRVQRADTRAVCEHAEAGTPARGDHVNSDVVQSVLHVSSVCQTRRALLSCARQDRPLTSA